jgi:hypothetical protein
VDSVSATHGLAGAADTIVVLCRKRQAAEGSIKVTGRDVPENEYALTLKDGIAWQLAAADLAGAVAVARQREEAAGLSDRSGEVLTFVNSHPGGAGPADVAAALSIDAKTAGTYLGRLAAGGKLARPSRGRYTPVESVGSAESTGSRPVSPFNTPNTFNTSPGTDLREVCDNPLDPALAAGGDTTHPGCGP